MSVRVTAQAVHLVVSVDGDWDLARAETVAEAEQRCEAAQEFSESELFRNRYPGRVGVVRLVVKHAPPEIVREVLTERGVEIELVGESESGDKTCALCKREQLAENVAVSYTHLDVYKRQRSVSVAGTTPAASLLQLVFARSTRHRARWWWASSTPVPIRRMTLPLAPTSAFTSR